MLCFLLITWDTKPLRKLLAEGPQQVLVNYMHIRWRTFELLRLFFWGFQDFLIYLPNYFWSLLNTPYLSVFSPNAEKGGRKPNQNSSEYEHFLRSDTTDLIFLRLFVPRRFPKLNIDGNNGKIRFFSYIYNLHFFKQKVYRQQVLIYLNVPGIPVKKPLQNSQIVGEQLDVWILGVICASFLTGRHLLINKKDKNSRYTNIKIMIIWRKT